MNFFGLGISIFILISAVRQEKKARIIFGSYGLLITLSGLSLVFWPEFNILFVFAVPLSLGYLINYWFLIKISRADIIFSVGLSILTGILAFTLNAIALIAFAFFGLSAIIIFLRLNRIFKTKGISVFLNPGNKIQWIVWFVITNTIYALIITGHFSGILQNPLIPEVAWIILCLQGLMYFAGRPSAFEPAIHVPKYVKSGIDLKEKYRILMTLDDEIRKREFFLRSDASIKGLAKVIGTSTHQLSQVINSFKGMSFHELTALQRIKKAKLLLRDPAINNIKIEHLAEEVGYLSKSSFNSFFKKITGKTPAEYREFVVRKDKLERLDHREITHSGPHSSTFEQVKNSIMMYSNFIKVYGRNILRNKLFSFINYTGLTVGLTSAILVLIYLQHELSYDKFHRDSENIYRAALISGNSQTRTPHPLSRQLVEDFPQVTAGVSISPIYGPGLTLQSIYIKNPESNDMFQEADCFFADSTFFNVFDFDLLVGNPDEALKVVGGVVISESLAKKYFGDENPLGKFLEFPAWDFAATVAGVMEDPPANSHFHPSLLLSYVTLKSNDPESGWFKWSDAGHFNYFRFSDGADPRELEDAMADWLPKYMDLSETDIARIRDRSDFMAFQPITDIHLKSNIRWELEANSSMTYVYILFAAIVLLVLIASINFVNLSTARVIERTREFGIRKTLGANQSGISTQLMLESITTSFICLLGSLLIAYLVFEPFGQLTGRQFDTSSLFSMQVLIPAIATALIIGLVTGFVPSLSLSNIKAGEIIKGKISRGSRSYLIRQGLIFLQFVLAAIMICGTVVVLQQISFMENKALGFDDEQVIVIDLHDQEGAQFEAFQNEINRLPDVTTSGALSNLPGSQFNQNSVFLASDPQNYVDCAELATDFNALRTLGLNLKEGRWFDPEFQGDSSGTNFLVNEATIKQLNTQNPFEEPIIWDSEDGNIRGRIVGILEDFHFKSLHQSIKPIIIQINPNELNYLLVKIKGQNVTQTIAAMEEIHDRFDQVFTMEHHFLDQSIDSQYDSERQAFSVFYLFSIIALILSVVGLIGLTYLVISQRVKEIGIRKVMGATTLSILWLENRSFLRIILISLLIGLPISGYFMQFWLSDFAYQVPFSSIPYLATSAVLIVVSIVSISFAALKTITINPVTALRHE